jgi:hypothetical protein
VGHEEFHELRVLDFPGGRGHAAVAVSCLEQFHFGADLEEAALRAALVDLSHRPEIERWVSLQLEISAMAHHPSPPTVERLLDQVRARVGERLEMVGLAEMAELEDDLARHHGWAAGLRGNLHQIRVDRDAVSRVLPPGSFRCSRAQLEPIELIRRPVPAVPGLTFRIMRLARPDGEVLALATPACSAAPTDDFVKWLAHFLPLIHDPLQTALFDYGTVRDPVWLMELRSGFPEKPEELQPQGLPRDRAVILTPWLWLRVAWALGVDPRSLD